MFNWVDIVLVTFLIFIVFKSFRDGFVSSVMSIFGFIFALVVSKIYHKPFSRYLEANFDWYVTMKEKFASQIMASFTNGSLDQNTNLIHDGIVLPQNVNGKFVHLFSNITSSEIAGSQAALTSGVIMDILSFLFLFVLVMIGVSIATAVLNMVATLPVFKEINKITGALFGLIKGTLLIYTFMALLVFLSPFIGKTGVITAVNASEIGSFFYNYNIILYIINIL